MYTIELDILKKIKSLNASFAPSGDSLGHCDANIFF
jgi:hypothetical protein